jgi:hypothetical protein
MPAQDPAIERARRRNREHLKRVTVSDITHGQELVMRKRARKCPLCDVRMTDKPHLPNSKELDHILPVNQGGTHTHGNVRIICRKCNQGRPKDGSDYAGMLTLWAQGPAPVSRPDGRRPVAGGMCRKGLHPWIPSNLKVIASRGRETCAACYEARQQRRLKPPRRCKCGALFQASGNQFMCPACIEATARKAAELHSQGGLTWDQVAAEVGYRSDWGAAYAARRIGYIPGPAVRTRGKDPAQAAPAASRVRPGGPRPARRATPGQPAWPAGQGPASYGHGHAGIAAGGRASEHGDPAGGGDKREHQDVSTDAHHGADSGGSTWSE